MYDHDHIENYEIREVDKINDFLGVYKVFRFPPYSEDWSDESIINTFNELKKDGKVFGLYVEDKCLGIVALNESIHPIKSINKKKIIYLSDLVVLSGYRKSNVAKELLEYAINYSKEKLYNEIYLRTLKGSSSYESDIIKKIGFVKKHDMCQIVKFPRTRMMKDEDCRFFWKYTIQ